MKTVEDVNEAEARRLGAGRRSGPGGSSGGFVRRPRRRAGLSAAGGGGGRRRPKDGGWLFVLLRLGHRAEASLDDAAVPVREFQSRAIGYSSTPERRQINQMRAQYMGLQQLYAAHARLLAADEDLARAVPDSEARLLRRARSAYDGAADSAARLYAVLGDVLTQQSTIASERLTLVATIFLPLTVITAFLGMNFGWRVDRIGTAPAFVLLGLVAPVLLTAAISLIIRRLTGPEL